MNCIVSGASSGIGKEICKYLLSKGHNVLAIARREELLMSLSKNVEQDDVKSEISPSASLINQDQKSEIGTAETESRPQSRSLSSVEGSDSAQLKILKADLSSEDSIPDIKEAIESLGKIDILINNAGALINRAFADTTSKDFIDQYKANVITAVNLIQACDSKLKVGSHIVNISSMGGFQGSSKYPGLAAYSAAKGALSILSECLAEEYQERKVSVNALALGAVQTEMLAEAFPGFDAGCSAEEMGKYIADFALSSGHLMSGKVIPVAFGNP